MDELKKHLEHVLAFCQDMMTAGLVVSLNLSWDSASNKTNAEVLLEAPERRAETEGDQ